VVPNPIETDEEEAQRESQQWRGCMQQSVGQPRHGIGLRDSRHWHVEDKQGDGDSEDAIAECHEPADVIAALSVAIGRLLVVFDHASFAHNGCLAIQCIELIGVAFRSREINGFDVAKVLRAEEATWLSTLRTCGALRLGGCTALGSRKDGGRIVDIRGVG
jgi:hypothetical protein